MNSPLRVMITSGGGPGVWGLLYALRRLPGRRTTLLVSDPADIPTLGTACADESLRLPPAADPEYLPTLLRTCRTRRVDVLIPVFDGELLPIAQNVREFTAIGTRVLLPPADVVRRCADKWATHAALAQTDLLPKHRLVRSTDETAMAIQELGYPDVRLCVRPTASAGSRGFHVLDANRDLFAEHMLRKPGERRLTADEFLAIRRSGPADFPLIVSEFLEGEELGVDLLADHGEVLEMTIRRKGGPQIHGNWTHIRFAEHAGERSWIERAARELQLDGLVCIDARYRGGPTSAAEDHTRELFLLEVNARPGAYIGASCTRLHLLGWAIDRLLRKTPLRRRDYLGATSAESLALRAFGDVIVQYGEARPLPIAAADSANSQEISDARAVPCGAPRR